MPRVSEPGPGLLLSRWWGPRGGKELRQGRPPRELLHRTPPRGPSRTRCGRGIYFPSLGREFKWDQIATKPTHFGKIKPFLLKCTRAHAHTHTHTAWLRLFALPHLKNCPGLMFRGYRLRTVCYVNPDQTNQAGAPQSYHSRPMRKVVSHCRSRCIFYKIEIIT